MSFRHNLLDTPLGPVVTVVDESGHVVQVGFHDPATGTGGSPLPGLRDPEATAPVDRALAEYFGGGRQSFALPLAPEGTDFRRTVWDCLQRIPYGQTWSYGQLASELGRPGAARAVGRAVGSNPVAILIPCHRVIGSSGTLTGYAGGLDRKARLLALERENGSSGARHSREGFALGDPHRSV